MEKKAYLIEIITLNDGSEVTTNTKKESYNNALMSLFQSMASAIANNNVAKAAICIMDDNGYTLKSEIWTR